MRTDNLDEPTMNQIMPQSAEDNAATVKRQRTLSALVTERNRLIHQDLSGFDHNSISSCRDLIAMLDEQNVRVLSQL